MKKITVFTCLLFFLFASCSKEKISEDVRKVSFPNPAELGTFMMLTNENGEIIHETDVSADSLPFSIPFEGTVDLT